MDTIIDADMTSDGQSIQEKLAILQTKLDYLIKNSDTDREYQVHLAKRINELESLKYWFTGGAAVIVSLLSVLMFASDAYVNMLIDANMKDRSVLSDVCDEHKSKRVPGSEFPVICKIL